jgi:aspartyl-tRNA(Asn)/glutamyl-tRNA(Gln) amidotransferase subunit A
MTIEEFGRRLRARETSAEEVTSDCLVRIEEHNPRLNAFITVMADEARRQARDADRELAAGIDRGPLHGVPVSIKDLFDIENLPTTAASRVREGHVARADAAAISRLRRAGAVLIGKTNLHEFAFGTTNEESAFGPVLNPRDTTRSSGGSSGGSAASIVAGMALASLGSDTGGSIRIPAAACGIVGLKPTYGEVGLLGAVPLSRTLDHAGPLTSCVADAGLMYRALVSPPDVNASVGPILPEVRRASGMNIGVLRGYFCDQLDDDVRRIFEDVLKVVAAAGARLDDVEVPHAPLTAPVYMHISFGEAAAYHAATLETMADRYTPPVRLRLELARTVMAEDYVRALEGRARLRGEVDRLLADHDVLALPTLPIPAPPLGATTVPVGATSQPVRALMLRQTQLFNLTGHPAISLPCGLTSTKLPVGLQLVGRRGETERLVRAARAIEGAILNGG